MLDYIIFGIIVTVLTVVGYFVSNSVMAETSFDEVASEKKELLTQIKPKPSKKVKPVKYKAAKEKDSGGSVSLASNIVKEALSNYKKMPAQNVEVKPQTIVNNKTAVKNEVPLVKENAKKTVKIEVTQKVTKIEEIKKAPKSAHKFEALVQPEIVSEPAKKKKEIKITNIEKPQPVKTENIPKPMENGPVTKMKTASKVKETPVQKVPEKPIKNEKKKINNNAYDPTADMVEVTEEVKKVVIKEKKKSPVDLGTKGPSFTDLTVVLGSTELTNNEIQLLVEALLNKQHLLKESFGEWVEAGKADPTLALKKQLSESQQSLSEQKDTNAALMSKIMALRTDLNSERQKSTMLKKQMDHIDADYSKKLESATLFNTEQMNHKIKEVSATLEQEFQKSLIQQKQKMEADYESAKANFSMVQSELEKQLQQLQMSRNDLENQLQQAVHRYDKRTNSVDAAFAESESKLQAITQSREELANTCQQYQQHINTLKEQATTTESMLSREIRELQSHLDASESGRTQTLAQLSQMTGDREQLLQELKNLENIREHFSQSQNKTKKMQLENTELESKLGKSNSEIADLNKLVKTQLTQIENLINEKESITAQVNELSSLKQNGAQEQHINGNSANETISALTEEIASLKQLLDTRQNKTDEDKRKYDEDRLKATQLFIKLLPEAKGYSTNILHLALCHFGFFAKLSSSPSGLMPR